MELKTSTLRARTEGVGQETNAQDRDHCQDFVSRHYKWNFVGILLESSLYCFVGSLLSVYTVLAYYVGQLTDSGVLIGLISAISVGGFFLPQLITAKYLRSKPRLRPYLLAGAALQRLGILGLLVLTLVQPSLSSQVTVILFFLVFTFYSATSGVYYPAFGDFVGKAIPRRKGMLFGLSNFVGGLLGLLGASLLTYLLTRLDYPQDMQYTFGLAFVASLLSFVVILLWREPPRPGKSERSNWSEYFGNVRSLLRHRVNFRKYLVWRAALTMGDMALPFYLTHAMSTFGLSDSLVGVFTLVLTVSQVVMNPVWGWIGDRKGHFNVIVAASVLGLAGAMLAALGKSALVFYFVFWAAGAQLGGVQVARLNILYEFGGSEETSTLIALSATVLSPLSALAPLLGGLLAMKAGYAPVFGIAAVVQAVSVLGLVLSVRNPATLDQGSGKEASGSP